MVFILVKLVCVCVIIVVMALFYALLHIIMFIALLPIRCITTHLVQLVFACVIIVFIALLPPLLHPQFSVLFCLLHYYRFDVLLHTHFKLVLLVIFVFIAFLFDASLHTYSKVSIFLCYYCAQLPPHYFYLLHYYRMYGYTQL